MTSPELRFSTTESERERERRLADRVCDLVEEFLGDEGRDSDPDSEPIDADAARRFIAATDAAWDAHQARA